jgi:DNA-binding NtrC family response regulator
MRPTSPRTKPARTTVVIVTTDEGVRPEAEACLAGEHDLLVLQSWDELTPVIRKQPLDAILLDLDTVGEGSKDGILALGELRALGPDVVLVGLTRSNSRNLRLQAVAAGVDEYFVAPINFVELRSILDRELEKRGLEIECRQRQSQQTERESFCDLIGGSEPMRRVYDAITRVAESTTTVLIRGESGTGKELVAQTLHDLSPRKDGPFVAVNCSAVPATLIESELFGHEKGSFTGATQQHRGVFERASGGTLFLDEITEMPAELQARLLRVLETANLTRIGGEEPVSVRVRVVAATNRSPERAVEAGRLRADLYYRLNVFPIQLPPLRERGEDVVLLAQHFLDELNGEAETEKPLSATARERLRSHGWPGNVRELRNAIHRAYIMAKDEVELETVQGPKLAGPGGDSREESGEAPLQEIERREILARLEKFSGDKRRTAASLGISLKTLYNRLNVYGGRPATS